MIGDVRQEHNAGEVGWQVNGKGEILTIAMTQRCHSEVAGTYNLKRNEVVPVHPVYAIIVGLIGIDGIFIGLSEHTGGIDALFRASSIAIDIQALKTAIDKLGLVFLSFTEEQFNCIRSDHVVSIEEV